MMELQFHGAVQTVTGSQYLLRVNGHTILLECGLYQGPRRESYERNLNLPFDAAEVDVMVLSHAHIDHSGNIPNLVKSGFQGDIVSTYATRDLCAIMLRDSGHIQESDIAYVNKKRRRRGEHPLSPIYTMADATASLNHFIGIGYERPYRLLPGITLTFYDAGHILGSAIVTLDIEEAETKRHWRLVFSGDLGRYNRPIIRNPTSLNDADILIMESTYGDRLHDPEVNIDEKLAGIVNQTYRLGGKVIVPAFAVGRTQELVYRLHQLMEAGTIPDDLHVYVDSPLAIEATGIYRLHPDAYDEQVADFLLESGQRDPFGFEMMRYTRTVTESKALNKLRHPAVIISASGMAETGRILHHLKNNIEDARNTILIVGWQAPDTLGRRLVERQSPVNIFGEPYQLKATVETLNGLSAHADQEELLAWADHFQQRPLYTFLVHGEPKPAQALSGLLQKSGFRQVHVPQPGQSFAISD
jgi:metallo-beta-lactamase family protein